MCYYSHLTWGIRTHIIPSFSDSPNPLNYSSHSQAHVWTWHVEIV